MKLCKFGGSSLASAEQIRKVCDIILSDSKRKYIVVSAPGKRYSNDIKVTDLLITLSQSVINKHNYQKELDEICQRYADIARQLGVEGNYADIVQSDLLSRINKYSSNSKLLLEALKAAGEDNCAHLLTSYLNSLDIAAEYVNPGEAGLELIQDSRGIHVDPDSYTRLAKLKNKENLQIFPGFFAYEKGSKNILTFSRGGSDITGSILSAALSVEVYENWTDVDGVYAVNPNLIYEPHPISELTYQEMRELAYVGFSVIHEEALEPVLRAGIPLNIRNTNNPANRGTRVVAERIDYDSIVTGISGSKGFTALHFSKYLMNREIGFVANVLKILADLKIPFEHLPTSIDSVSVIMRDEVLTEEKERLIKQRLYDELGVKNVKVERSYAIVMIVGDAMAQTVGVAHRAVKALSSAGINIEFMVQAGSEISLVFGVKEPFCNYAVTELYKTFFGTMPKSAPQKD